MPSSTGQPATLRNLMLLGIVLTVIGLIGLVITAGDPDASRALVRYVLVPMYALGAVMLVGAGVWWLVQYSRRDHDVHPPGASQP